LLPRDTAPQLHILHRDERRGAREVWMRVSPARVVITSYLVLSFVPIYWLLCMSLKTNAEILGELTMVPKRPTLANFAIIFTDPDWRNGYINSITYVAINT